MKTVGIICEYNPFHLGHSLQLRSVREKLREQGEDTCIVALMCGSFVQRGGAAVLPKEARAAIALSEGADLVLELPFPWCMSGADRFAAGAVAILEGLGGVDYLAFGSETGNMDELAKIARVIASPEFDTAVGAAAEARPDLSFAAQREIAYAELTGEPLPKLAPNDLLGVAYLSHIRAIGPLVLHRLPGYSATKARGALQEHDFDALHELVPPATLGALKASEGLSQDAIDKALISHLLLTPAEVIATAAECNRELASRLTDTAERSRTVSEVVKKATSKHYTAARVRRALWHSYLQTPADAPLGLPHYANLLAANERGRVFLRAVAKKSEITVVTRPSNATKDPQIAAQYAFSETRDRVFCLFSGIPTEKKPPILK